MNKKYVIIIVLLLIFTFNSYIKADEIENKAEEINVEEKNKETILENIKFCKEELKQELLKIDEKLEGIKQKQEYKNYPAIRLNIDTPIFGLVSVCNHKLKITTEVSTADVAKGYSIKDIIKNNSLKVPSFSVGSIVVITRDIKLDDTITLVDANTSVFKLVQYIEQAQSVNEFLDKQIIKIYSEYIPKNKSEKIENLKSRIDNIEKDLTELNNLLLKLYISKVDDEKYSEYLKEYININNNIYKYEEVLKDVLITDEELLDYEKKVIDLEANHLMLKQNVIKSNENILENIDFEKTFENVRNNLINRKENIEKYIDSSSEIKYIENKDLVILEENSEDNNEKNRESEDLQKDISENQESLDAKEEITIYNITSTQILEELNKNIDSLDKKIIEIIGETNLNRIKNVQTDEVSEEVVNKDEVTNVVIKELNLEEKEKVLSEISNIYNQFLTNENKFYLDNINLILKDTANKISSLSTYTDYSTISDITYVYMELPKLLKNDTEIYDMKLNIELDSFTNSIKEKLEKLLTININVTKMYNEKISEEMKNNSRENN